ncbi:ribonuclease H-like domain-containing protein [Tanacetum coccineum]
MESQSETTQTVSTLKLPMLKTGDYDLWSMRMEQYLTHTDYAFWEVIVNGDATASIASASAGTEGPIPPKTAEQKLARKNELKAKSTMLLAIPDEHLLKFHEIKDAKTLWEAIKTRVEKILKETGRNLNVNWQRTVGFDKTNVEYYNCHRRGHIARECRAPRNQGNRNGDAPRRNAPAEEGITNFALMAYTSQGSSSSSSSDSEDTDSDNDSVFRPKSDQTKPKLTKINFVKSNENVKSVNKENTHRQVEYPRKSQSPRENRRKWNGMMTRKLGNGFEFIKKACFVCGSFNHLIKDCDFHDNKMVEKPMLNNKGRVTGQREIRPVWNNAQRVNHQNKLTHPHPKRKFIPIAVLTKSWKVLVNVVKQSSPRAAASISTARPVNTTAPKSKVNDAVPKTYSYFKAHSPVRRAFNQKSAAKTNNLNKKVKTAKVNNVTYYWAQKQ